MILAGNRKGEKILSVYWFAVLFIVAAAVSYMVYAFYGDPYDVRGAEADALTDLVARCFVDGGYLKEGVLSGESFSETLKENFLGECRINFNVEDDYRWKDKEQYYVRVSLKDFSTKNLLDEVSGGNPSISRECGREGRGLPYCLERSFYAVNIENNQYQFDVLSVILKTEKNVR